MVSHKKENQSSSSRNKSLRLWMIQHLRLILIIKLWSRESNLRRNKSKKKFKCICYILLHLSSNYKLVNIAMLQSFLLKVSIYILQNKKRLLIQALANQILVLWSENRSRIWQSSHRLSINGIHKIKIIWKIFCSCDSNSTWNKWTIIKEWVDLPSNYLRAL